MTFNPDNPPKGFPVGGLQTINRRPYITHIGLVWLQNQSGKPWSSTIDDLKINYNDQGFPVCAVVVATVTDGESSHTAVGDCSTQSTNAKIAPHLIRMAGTRAKNRGLRLLVGYAGTTAEEIPLESRNGNGKHLPPGYGGGENRALAMGAEPEDWGPGLTGAEPLPEDWSVGLTGASGWALPATQAPQPSPNGGGPSCPDCGGEMWDNTEQRRRQQEEYAAGTRENKAGPGFRCKDKVCADKDGFLWDAPSQDDIDQQEMSADPGAWEMGHEQHNKDRS